MCTGNEGVSFTAAKGGFEPVNGRDCSVSCKTGKDLGENHLETICRVGCLPEKLLTICIQGMDGRTLTGVVPNHLTERGCKDFGIKGTT